MSFSTRILCALALAASLFFGGYFLGKADERADQAANEAVALETVIVTHNETAAVGQTVERETVQRTAKTAAVFNGISVGVIDYAKSHPDAGICRLDADGVRLWTEANAGADPRPAAERHGVLRGAASAAERRDDRPAGKPHRGSQGVSRVPGSTPGTDQLAGENP